MAGGLACLPRHHRPADPRTPLPLPLILPQVCVNDDMDDSDAEHAYLREKRMRRPARVWRSARERAVWLRMTQAAETAEQAAYCTWILCDRWARRVWMACGWLWLRVS